MQRSSLGPIKGANMTERRNFLAPTPALRWRGIFRTPRRKDVRLAWATLNAPSPRYVYRHILCHQSTAMAFSIRRVAPSPRCVYRHILCHQSAQHAVDPCRDTAARSRVLVRARRSTSTRFHSTCICPHASRPSRSRDRPQAHGHSHRGSALLRALPPNDPDSRTLARQIRGLQTLGTATNLAGARDNFVVAFTQISLAAFKALVSRLIGP